MSVYVLALPDSKQERLDMIEFWKLTGKIVGRVSAKPALILTVDDPALDAWMQAWSSTFGAARIDQPAPTFGLGQFATDDLVSDGSAPDTSQSPETPKPSCARCGRQVRLGAYGLCLRCRRAVRQEENNGSAPAGETIEEQPADKATDLPGAEDAQEEPEPTGAAPVQEKQPASLLEMAGRADWKSTELTIFADDRVQNGRFVKRHQSGIKGRRLG